MKTQRIQSEFSTFGKWLSRRTGSHRAALSIHKHFAFFKVVDDLWGRWPPANELALRLGLPGLRKARTPLLWLRSTKNYFVDSELLCQLQEQDRIARIAAEVPLDRPLGLVLQGYHDHLRVKTDAQAMKLRSARISLRAAVDVVLAAISDRAITVEQRHVDRVLKSKPGVTAALWGFVVFMNGQLQEGSIPLKISKPRVEQIRRFKLEKDMIELAAAARTGRDVRRQWLTRSLAYFHHQYAKNSSQFKSTHDPEGNGYIVTLANKEYWVPDPLRLTLIQPLPET